MCMSKYLSSLLAIGAVVATAHEAEMVAPWEDRTPPLAVDVGVGRTWLDAK